MMRQTRGWIGALVVSTLALLGHECRAGMTLQFNITPTQQPTSGSLVQEADGTLVATNLAISSVSSVDTGKTVGLSKYLDFQSGGSGGANFFVLDGPVQQAEASGDKPTALSSPGGATNLTKLAGGGYVFTMKVAYGYVASGLSSQFGVSPAEYGWTGLLTLDIAEFNPYLASAQVTMGTLVLTSNAAVAPIIAPIPAGETVNPSVVPEPASVLLAGLGLLAVGASRTRARRPR